jgi:hypothetical protein
MLAIKLKVAELFRKHEDLLKEKDRLIKDLINAKSEKENDDAIAGIKEVESAIEIFMRTTIACEHDILSY